MAIKRRAMSDHQKQARRQKIIETTTQIFQETSYDAVNMADIAKKVGVAKGTLYLYFQTKESLFLAIQTELFERWFDEVDSSLETMATSTQPVTISKVVMLISQTLSKYPTLVRLIAILHTILEQNSDFETVLTFKQMLRTRSLHTAQLLETCLTFLQPGDGLRLLLQIHALIIGLQHMAEPADIVQQVLEEPGLEIFKIDFTPEFLDVLKALIYGLQYQSTEESDE